MTSHLHREIEGLKKRILSLSAIVEESVQLAVKALEDRDAALAARVIKNDDDVIDLAEVDVEEECLKLLALYQPVATDLRFIIAVLKINSDLERIGDMAVNIAERADFLADEAPTPVPAMIGQMASAAQKMLKDSLDALVNMDGHLAARIFVADDEVDELNRRMYFETQDRIRSHPEELERLMHILSVSRHLERIADHATNIAEDVIYMVSGEIIRHKATDYKAQF
ncbi:MAG TPA: phosphate signaling complex protein PhoU [Armatimonadota bacterium]|nr:phosphate signaling complex protein PhoU [Armatimonadota bacterium]